MMYRIVQEAPDLDALPAPLRGTIAACLEKEPGRRPPPDRIVEECRRLSPDGTLRVAGNRLPGPVAAEIERRQRLTPGEAVDGTGAPGPGGLPAGPPPPAPAAGPTAPLTAPGQGSDGGRRRRRGPLVLPAALAVAAAVIGDTLLITHLTGDDPGTGAATGHTAKEPTVGQDDDADAPESTPGTEPTEGSGDDREVGAGRKPHREAPFRSRSPPRAIPRTRPWHWEPATGRESAWWNWKH